MFRVERDTHPHHHDPESDATISCVADDQHWFVAVVSNPYRYKTRYALFRKFKEHILKDLRANLLVVECALGERGHQVVGQQETAWPNYKEVRVQNTTQLWQKENLMNIGLQRLPPCARYITFVDADIHFVNPHVVTEIVHALQIHKVVQPFETCTDLGPHGEVINVHRSFGWCHAHGFEFRASKSANLSAGSGLYHRYGHVGVSFPFFTPSSFTPCNLDGTIILLAKGFVTQIFHVIVLSVSIYVADCRGRSWPYKMQSNKTVHKMAFSQYGHNHVSIHILPAMRNPPIGKLHAAMSAHSVACGDLLPNLPLPAHAAFILPASFLYHVSPSDSCSDLLWPDP